MKKSIGILLYLILMAVFLKFDLRLLFDLRQFVLVLFGTILLLLPSLREQNVRNGEGQGLPGTDKRKFISRVKDFFVNEQARIGQNAIWAGILQTFVLLFLNMNLVGGELSAMQTAAISCRPILYGFCIWIILQDSKRTEGIAHNGDSDNAPSNGKMPADVLQTPVDYRNCLQAMGLTKREVEIAFHVTQNETNAQIAERLFISETTVKKHLSNIFSKLEIGQRQQIKEKCLEFSEEKLQEQPTEK